MTSVFSVECDRCGEKFRPSDTEDIFHVGYKTIEDSEMTGDKVWRRLDLCESCQKDLRLEFYKRGITKRNG